MRLSRAGLKRAALHQAEEFFWIFIYLWICFGLFILYRSMLLSEHDIIYADHGLAFVKALVLGKVILVGKDLRLGESFANRPLIYPTLCKSAIFLVVLVLFSLLGEIVRDLFRHETIRESLTGLGENSPVTLVNGLFMFVILIPFFAFQEIGRILGERTLSQLFFFRGADAIRDRATVGAVHPDSQGATDL